MTVSAHQETYCPLCADDATSHNHCSWCGATFGTLQELIDHLDGPCWDRIQSALCKMMEG